MVALKVFGSPRPSIGTAVLDLVAGARPNLIKLAPVFQALVELQRARPRIVHTGQHYDERMSRVFLRELNLPEPEVDLGVGSGTHGEQTARILERYERHLLAARPAATVVFGDVNSTVGCALSAAKLGVPIAHVEAGLRSFDRSMPEEINRIVTDALAELLLVTEPSGVENLEREGRGSKEIRWVGNVMIDTLLAELPRARDLERAKGLGLNAGRYGLVTLHRPSNVDNRKTLLRLLELLQELAEQLPLVFPVHPRTAAAMESQGLAGRLTDDDHRLRILPPQPYLDHLSLMASSAVVLTDSGGMQEETAVLGIPCLTLRESTERPITVEFGTSRLVGNDPARIRAAFDQALDGSWPDSRPIPLWDGKAGQRVAEALVEWVRA